jgi:hypothetical protein
MQAIDSADFDPPTTAIICRLPSASHRAISADNNFVP